MESMFSAGLRKYVLSLQKVIHNLVVSVMVVFIVSIFKGLFFYFWSCVHTDSINKFHNSVRLIAYRSDVALSLECKTEIDDGILQTESREHFSKD